MFNLYPKFGCTNVLRLGFALILLSCTSTSIQAQEMTNTKLVKENTLGGTQQTAGGKLTIRPIRTDSPRHTLKSLLRLRDELEQILLSYNSNRTRDLARHSKMITSQIHAFIGT